MANHFVVGFWRLSIEFLKDRDGVGLAASSKEDSPDSAPRARPLRSKQTGQNSIAPENSLPQLGQVRWGSVFMDLTVLQPQFERKPTAHSTFTAPDKAIVPFHKQMRLHLSQRFKSSFGTRFLPLVTCRLPVAEGIVDRGLRYLGMDRRAKQRI